ncbi:ABC transporter substrate-binding protein [Nocardia sp. NBC_01499]|uniref:ABC transporter substrate-binding protein n=1 Tax=Nocardia sp. NBC_01499 TaxID=2903597 RepID=UPI00386C7036
MRSGGTSGTLSRRTALVTGVLALTAVAAGCGTRDSATTEDGSTSVEHQYGTTTIPAKPRTVVSMAGNWTDTLLALNVPIRAEFVTTGYAGKDNRFAWTPPHESEVLEMTFANAVDPERIAKFEPDLILAGYLNDQAAYERLSKIAPTLPILDRAAVVDTWQTVATTAGKIFGLTTEAEALIGRTEQLIRTTTSTYPAANGATFAFGQLTPDRQFGLVADTRDAAARLAGALGLRLLPALEQFGQGKRVLVSVERADLLASDLLLIWPLRGGPESFDTIPGWHDLPAVRSGAITYLTNDDAAAFASPSVLSVPYAVDRITPALRQLRREQ